MMVNVGMPWLTAMCSGAELHPIKRSACASSAASVCRSHARDEHGVGARCSSDRLHLGFLSRSPEQQYTSA